MCEKKGMEKKLSNKRGGEVKYCKRAGIVFLSLSLHRHLPLPVCAGIASKTRFRNHIDTAKQLSLLLRFSL